MLPDPDYRALQQPQLFPD